MLRAVTVCSSEDLGIYLIIFNHGRSKYFILIYYTFVILLPWNAAVSLAKGYLFSELTGKQNQGILTKQ